MFQPQPTPFAAAVFASYGVAGHHHHLQQQQQQQHHHHHAAQHQQHHQQLPHQPQNHHLHNHHSHHLAGPGFVQFAPSAPPPPPPPSSSSASAPLAASLQNNGAAAVSSLLFAHHPHSQQPPSSAAHFSSYNAQSTPTPTPPQQQQPPPQAGKMDPSSLEDDLAAQQAAARNYQPDLEGPLVGNKTPSEAITAEYARADQVYIDKTIALPQTYSHYRPVQGDGNCGWRAIGFSYFETMVQLFDKQQISNELQRITNLNQYILTVGGYDITLFEDMVEETVSLLSDLTAIIADRKAAMALLMGRFNDRDCSNAIIYHLRLLASSWLKENAAAFQDFIADVGGVLGYCQDAIERPDREIEHLGIVLLSNVLLKPVGFVLEIAYLDRSAGSEVNTYRFPEEANQKDESELGPTIHLLFRPDHYDILYKIPPPAKPIDLQVHKVTSTKHNINVIDTGPALDGFSDADFSTLTLIPGLEPMGFGPPGVGPSSLDGFLPTATLPWVAQPFAEPLAPAPQPPPPPQTRPTPLPAPPTQLPPPQTTSAAPTTTQYPLRFSREMQRLQTDSFPTEQTFTTNTFKNSHFNKAHYNNPEFHPEEWTPDDDTPEPRSGRRRGRGSKQE